jgi:hypothetical protein
MTGERVFYAVKRIPTEREAARHPAPRVLPPVPSRDKRKESQRLSTFVENWREKRVPDRNLTGRIAR